MNICLPYIYLVGDLFRCLFKDLKIDFTSAPKPGKYTLQIGSSFSGGTLCPGLQRVLGSVAECYYLGSDTALVFAPCGGCSAERIKAKLTNCLKENGIGMKIITFEPDYYAQKSFWKGLKAESPVSLPEFLSTKARFFECVKHLQAFLELKNQVVLNSVSEVYLEKIMKDILSARTLLDLKLLLSLYTKRLGLLEREEIPRVADIKTAPYLNKDYFNTEKTGAFESSFFIPSKKAGKIQDEYIQPKCEISAYLNV